ncbi:hypothetical protein AN944_00925 [Shewanella sp. P1-14-1]|nr:hypothetical protein AN944_00925 [Shewanella sp. P1-14-1]
MNKFDFRFDSAPNPKAKVVRYFVYTLLVSISTFLYVYFVHYMGSILNIDVNQPLRELPMNVVFWGLLGMFVTLALIFTVLLMLARVIFINLKV